MSDRSQHRDLEHCRVGRCESEDACFRIGRTVKGALSFTLYQCPSATLVCVGVESMAGGGGEDASTHCYGEGIHAAYPAPPVSLGVTDEHKVCDGARSHSSTEEMSKQIHPWCRPRVLITRSIFCNRGQRVRLIYCVRMHMEEENLEDLTDSMSRKRCCTFFFSFSSHFQAVVLLLFVCLWRLSLVCFFPSAPALTPAVAWQGDAAADSSWAGRVLQAELGHDKPFWSTLRTQRSTDTKKLVEFFNALTSCIILKPRCVSSAGVF